MEALKLKHYYTYEEWYDLDDNTRSELLNGVLYMMAPPSRRHQAILVELCRQFANFLRGKPCNVYPAPFSVRLDKGKDTVFQPDIVVVCDSSKLTDKDCEGAPELVIEILSPSTSQYDRFTKFNEYLRAGVQEYWIVDPRDNTATAHRLKNGAYVTETYSDESVAKPHVLPGCDIDLSLVFHE